MPVQMSCVLQMVGSQIVLRRKQDDVAYRRDVVAPMSGHFAECGLKPCRRLQSRLLVGDDLPKYSIQHEYVYFMYMALHTYIAHRRPSIHQIHHLSGKRCQLYAGTVGITTQNNRHSRENDFSISRSVVVRSVGERVGYCH